MPFPTQFHRPQNLSRLVGDGHLGLRGRFQGGLMGSVVALAKLVNNDCIYAIPQTGFRPQLSSLLAVGFRQEIGIEDAGIDIDLPFGTDSTAGILMGVEGAPFDGVVMIAGADSIPGNTELVIRMRIVCRVGDCASTWS